MTLSSIAAYLDQLARSRATRNYGAMARDLGLRLAVLTAALETLMEEDQAQAAPLRAALCEARLGNGLPALGFFEKAASLGYDLADPAAFVAAHRQALYDRAAIAP